MTSEGVSLRRALTVWGVALLVYMLAVFHRSSLAVAGLAATERFDISASQLASFTMLQLLVYAAMQIPVGLMLDRFGPRRVLLVGVLTLTVAQLGFAFAATYPQALVTRLFVGVGDAMVFVCVLRLVTSWFAPRQIPVVTQLTGLTGQLGAIAAALPMTFALRALGWTEAYVLTASVGFVLAVVMFALVHDTPERRVDAGEKFVAAEVAAALRASWGHPGTRLGFWTHFTAQFGPTILALLWGYPFFVAGQGTSPAMAGILLTVLTMATMVSGPIVGWLVANRPYHRSSLVLVIVAAIVTVWTVVLAWPGNAPLPLLFMLVIVVGVGGPGSMVAFDFARSFNPPARLGSATGVVNQGGFIASLTTVVAIGIVLDWQTPPGAGYSPEAFTWAMSVQYVLWTIGIVQIWRYRRRARRLIHREDPARFEALRNGEPVHA